MREPISSPMPLDQADGLRRLFAHSRVCVVPVVSNPNVAFGGVMLERLCTAFGEHGKHTLVVDAGERVETHAPDANLHAPLIRDFAEAVLNDRAPAVGGDVGRMVAAIEEEIYRQE